MFIYRITNIKNGMSYIGKTTYPLHIRWKQHCNPKSKTLIAKVIREQGVANFTIEKLGIYLDPKHLNNAEEYFIEYYCTLYPDGYNLQGGGYSKILCDKSREKMSEAHKGEIQTKERVDKRVKSNTGKIRTEQQRLNISNSLKGKKRQPLSEETRKKISQALSGKPKSDEHRQNIKKSHKERRK